MSREAHAQIEDGGGADVPVARLREVSLRYGKACALDEVTIDIPAGCMAGLIGPDGVGKSSLLALVAGARAVQTGQVAVLGGDMACLLYTSPSPRDRG